MFLPSSFPPLCSTGPTRISPAEMQCASPRPPPCSFLVSCFVSGLRRRVNIHLVDSAPTVELQQRLLEGFETHHIHGQGQSFPFLRGLCPSLPLSPHSPGTDALCLLRQVAWPCLTWVSLPIVLIVLSFGLVSNNCCVFLSFLKKSSLNFCYSIASVLCFSFWPLGM